MSITTIKHSNPLVESKEIKVVSGLDPTFILAESGLFQWEFTGTSTINFDITGFPDGSEVSIFVSNGAPGGILNFASGIWTPRSLDALQPFVDSGAWFKVTTIESTPYVFFMEILTES